MGITKLNKSVRANAGLIAFYLIIVYIINVIIIAYSRYSAIFEWWGDNNGSESGCLDIMSIALFNYSSLVFKLRQLFISSAKSIDTTEIQFLQAVALNQAKVFKTHIDPNIPDDVFKDLGQSNFVLPIHLCNSIAWGEADIDIFRQGILTYYGSISTGNLPPWYSNWVKEGMPGPTSALWGTPITGNNDCNGFWPHQNGLTGFFDTIDPSKTPYNLSSKLAKSVYIDESSGKSFFYIPGDKGPQGSWAQLFADWGIVYSEDTGKATSTVPILNINPGSAKASIANTDKWFASGYTNSYNGQLTRSDGKTSLNGNSFYGPNFFSIYFINPSSYLLTGWVGGSYDDPTTGIVFDAQAIKNLIGTGTEILRNQSGGWVTFLKGILKSDISYDSLMNMFFTNYQTNLSPDPVKRKCGGGSRIRSFFSAAIPILAMAVMIVPGVGEAAAAAALAARVGIGAASLAAGGLAAASACA